MDRRMALMSKTSNDQDRYQLEMDRLRIEIEKLKDKSERSQAEVVRLQAKIDVDDQEKRQRDRLVSSSEKQREDLTLETERLRDRYAKLQMDYERIGQEKERADSTVRSNKTSQIFKEYLDMPSSPKHSSLPSIALGMKFESALLHKEFINQ